MILDTNGLSAVADGDPALAPILQSASELAVPVIVLGEFNFGIWGSRDRLRYEKWLAGFVPDSRLLVVDAGTARAYAQIRLELKQKGRPIPANDLWIAALSRQHSMPLISRDRHFDFVRGLTRVTW